MLCSLVGQVRRVVQSKHWSLGPGAEQALVIGAGPNLRHKDSNKLVGITSMFTWHNSSVSYKMSNLKLFQSILRHYNSKLLPLSSTTCLISDSAKNLGSSTTLKCRHKGRHTTHTHHTHTNTPPTQSYSMRLYHKILQYDVLLRGIKCFSEIHKPVVNLLNRFNNVETSYFTQLKICYLMTTFRCPSDILIKS